MKMLPNIVGSSPHLENEALLLELKDTHTVHMALLLCSGDSCVDLLQFLYQKGFPCSSGCRNLHSTSKAAEAVGLRSKKTSKSQVTHSPRKYGK